MSGGGGTSSKEVSPAINVTPLIDVLLVLLIIFLVVMPIMLKVETLDVPREITSGEYSDATQLTLKVKNDLSMTLHDSASDAETPIAAIDVARVLRPRVAAMAQTQDKVVFVDFEDGVPWTEVVSTMDTVRSIAADTNHDEVKVALKVKPDADP